MADGLARLLAPILPVTADELWRHLPTFAEATVGKPTFAEATVGTPTFAEASAGTREASVHLAEFPKDVDSLIDPELDARWTRLREIRDQVNGALETARQEKLIGTSLAARVALTAGGEAAALLRRSEADLPMLFIVSQVTLDTGGPEGVSVSVSRAEGEKCDRCWRIVPDRSTSLRTEVLCSRCIASLPAGDGGREVA
jgi:isoleucyl-tRNA synthetase